MLRIDPSHPQALFSLGVILASEGRFDESRRRFEAAVEHEPDYVQARLALAQLLLERGSPEEALAQYEAVVEVDPRRVEAWIEGANVRIGLDRYGDADAWLRAARQVHPDVADLAALHDTRRGRPRSAAQPPLTAPRPPPFPAGGSASVRHPAGAPPPLCGGARRSLRPLPRWVVSQRSDSSVSAPVLSPMRSTGTPIFPSRLT